MDVFRRSFSNHFIFVKIECHLEMGEQSTVNWSIWPHFKDLLLIFHCFSQLGGEFSNCFLILLKLNLDYLLFDSQVNRSLQVVTLDHLDEFLPDFVSNCLLILLDLCHYGRHHECSKHCYNYSKASLILIH